MTASAQIASPDTASPETASPDTASPETASPDTASPDTASPETASPETASPETASPETASPESTSPAAGRPARYPLALDLTGRRAVVVGGGAVALRRAAALLEAGALVSVIAPAVRPELAALDVVVHARPYRPGDLGGAWLAHAATDDPGVNAAVAAEAERARIWCARADDAAASAAWTPAVARHGDVTVAVTAGGDPRRSQRLRAAISLALAEGRLPLQRHRRPSARPSSHAAPANHILPSSHAVPSSPGHEPGPGDREQRGSVVTAETTAAGTQSRGWGPAARTASDTDAGSVALIGGGPGDPGLITVLGRRLLAEADVVVVDKLAPRGLLAELDPGAEIIDAGKAPHACNLTQDEINTLIVSRALAGQRVARLKGGDPFVFGRGGEEALACVRAGLPVQVVPGVTSAVAVPAYAGIPVTHRGVTQDFAVVSAHLDPSHPGATVDWESLARGPGTLVLMMAVSHLRQITAELIKHGRSAGTPAAVISHGTTPAQQVLTSTLGQLAAEAASRDIRPPAVVVVGEVVRLRDLLGASAAGFPGAAGPRAGAA